ncbi:MAG: helix-turn-helix domain-containing protein [Bacteroidetes bacterium]|nr:helix-turn-helix domain-containing protein [Bacteroidota bacterium]MDA1333270.1 helix-turn-helix domain-containing protein [Bacteroidota bacterium]
MAYSFNTIAELGPLVRYHRKRAGLSRANLAEVSGVGQTVIYELEHGKETVQFDVIRKLFDVLNLQMQVDGPLVKAYQDETEGQNEQEG